MQECELAIRHDCNVARAYATLSQAAIALGRIDQALDFADAAKKLDPLSVRSHIPGIEAALCSGKYELCLSKCSVAQQLPGSAEPRVFYMAGLASFYSGNMSDQYLSSSAPSR